MSTLDGPNRSKCSIALTCPARSRLLRSFRGQHSEKMKESTRGTWDPREGQQPFGPNPNGVRDRTTALRRLLIGAVCPQSRWRATVAQTRGKPSRLVSKFPSFKIPLETLAITSYTSKYAKQRKSPQSAVSMNTTMQPLRSLNT